MVYAIQVGPRVHHWSHAQARSNLQFLANYNIHRYPSKKLGLLSHIFRAIASPFYSIRFYYTFGNKHHANKLLFQLRPMIAADYEMAVLFNRLAPFYHMNCLDLPQAPVIYTAPAIIPAPVVPAPVVYTHVPAPVIHLPAPAPVVHIPAPVIQPRRSLFSRLMENSGGRQIPGTGAVNVAPRVHVTETPVLLNRNITVAPAPAAPVRQLPGTGAVNLAPRAHVYEPQPLATRHITAVPQPAPVRQLPGTDVVTTARPAKAMRQLDTSDMFSSRKQTFTPTMEISRSNRVAVGGRR